MIKNYAKEIVDKATLDYLDENKNWKPTNASILNPEEITTVIRSKISKPDVNQSSGGQMTESYMDPIKVSMLVDTTGSDSKSENALQVVERIRDQVIPDPQSKKQKICRYCWGNFIFIGTIQSLQATYTLFNSSGIPLRARLEITLDQVLGPEEQKLLNRDGDSRKYHSVIEGDRLDAISARYYGDSRKWKLIAAENDIEHPIDFPLAEHLGQTLLIPDLEKFV